MVKAHLCLPCTCASFIAAGQHCLGADNLPEGTPAVPNLKLSLRTASASICSNGGEILLQQLQANMSTTASISGLVELNVLFANPGMQECIQNLSQATTVSFQPTKPGSTVSFCLANMQLLPPSVYTAGKQPTSLNIHYPLNCHSVSTQSLLS